MSVFSYTYAEKGNLIAAIIPANTTSDLSDLIVANLHLYNANQEIRDRFDHQLDSMRAYRRTILDRKPIVE